MGVELGGGRGARGKKLVAWLARGNLVFLSSSVSRPGPFQATPLWCGLVVCGYEEISPWLHTEAAAVVTLANQERPS